MRRNFAVIILLLASLAGCSNSTDDFVLTSPNPTTTRTSVVFEPFHDPLSQAVASQNVRGQTDAGYLDQVVSIERIPVPNDLLRDPATGLNALPTPPSDAPKYLHHAVEAMNTLSGFSTGGRITIPLDGSVEVGSVTAQSVLVLAEDGTSAPMAVTSESDQLLVLTPLVALRPDTNYLVVVTSRVLDASGLPLVSGPQLQATKSRTPLVVPGLSQQQAQGFEEIRIRMQSVWQAAEAATGEPRENIPLAFRFRTQPLFSTLQFIHQSVQDSTVVPTITKSCTTPEEIDDYYKNTLNVFHDVSNQVSGPDGVVAAHDQVGAIYVGTIPAPWYITNDTEGPFVYNAAGQPVVNATRNLQFMAILPKGAGPFPAVIFQHGLTRTKADMAGLANDACARGRGTIGVDLVLHGANARPRFSDGFDFYNQDYLTMMRDNVRQSVANLFVLNRLVSSGNANLDGLPGPELLGGPTAYIGHSEGAFIGGTFTPLESDNRSAVLAGGSAQLLPSIQANEMFRSQFDNALQNLGKITPGSFYYKEYYFIAQTLMDDADSFNHLPHALAGTLRGGAPAGATLLQDMFEAINLGPLVVVAESQAQARALGAPQVSPLQLWPGLSTVNAPFLGSGEYQYRGGGHNWLLEPSEGPPNGDTTESSRVQAFHFIETVERGAAEIINVFQGPDVSLGQDP